jgi:branched-chain amino acid transport system substrate-binding protein
VAWTVSATVQKLKIPFLVTTASADKITEAGNDYLFRINPPVSEHPKELCSFVKEIGSIETAAVIQEDTLFGEFWAKKFLSQSEKMGIQAVTREIYDPGAADYRTMLGEIRAREPHLIYMVSDTMDAPLMMRQAEELNINPKMFLGHPAGFTPTEFQINAGYASEFVYSHVLWSPRLPYPGVQEYYERYMTLYGSVPDYHGAQAYAGIQVLAQALKTADSFTPQEIGRALSDTKMMTILGPVRFVTYGKKRQQNRAPTYLVQWINGQSEIVWPLKTATSPYVYPTPGWQER